MKYVLDSNIALKTVLPESDSAHAVQLIAAFRQIVMLEGCRCRCGHEWLPREQGEKPRVCPKCKSPYWDRTKHQGGGQSAAHCQPR